MKVLKSLIKALMPRGLWPSALVARHVVARTGGIVQRGPFQGLRLIQPSWNAHAGKLAGVYEREIYPALESLKGRSGGERWSVLNIGAADGFYAVGVARWDAVAVVHAFEMEAHSRQLLSRNGDANGISAKLIIDGECTPERFSHSLDRHPSPVFVLCDVEGFEDQLLDLDRFPALARCHLLVEVHEVLCPGVAERLRSRFAATHRIDEIHPQPRVRADFDFENWWTRWLKDFYITQAIGDGRPAGIYWYFMSPATAKP